MCDPVTISYIGAAALGTSYVSDKQGSAQSKARNLQTQQGLMAQDAETKRRLQEQQIADAALSAQQEAMAEQTRMFNEQQAAAQRQAEEARQAEVRRQGNITEGQGIISDMFGQFDDGFYSTQQQNYVDYAKPQLQTQYQDAMQSLTRSLARSGNLSSSLRGQSMADLQRQFDQGLSTIQSQGATYAGQSKSAIEQARSGLLSQNANLADPGTIRGLTESQVKSLGQAQTYTPLSSLISALTRSSSAATAAEGKKETTQGVGLISNGLTGSSSSVVQ